MNKRLIIRNFTIKSIFILEAPLINVKYHKVIPLVLLLLQSINLIGQGIKTSVEKLEYNITDKIVVQYQIAKEVDPNEELDQSQFKVVEGPSKNISLTYVNGKSVSSTVYTYVIEARKTGKLDLPQLTMHFEGKDIKSEKLYINVVGVLLTEQQISDKIKSANSPYKEYHVGQAFEISLPAYIKQAEGINSDAAIEYVNRENNIYGYTLVETKEDILLSGGKYTTLDAYHGNIIKNFSKDLAKKTVSTPLSNKGKEISFIENDVTYFDAETNKDLYYFIGSVETKTAFYTVVLYTFNKNKSEFKADFQKILYSLKD
ncbi:BatD family protein [Flavobacterium sp. JLP]|uniref:BatD family protein n=1 Tax=unclassified Flavobacterium TaxID=196869 RepID=UPI00188BC352|nr:MULTISPECIES: BatD family protein [unclassified Flavobacterium]MBF4494411.1 BatD family protein [Flavobacterium sp. MR2016-29]MBF4508750.1 BatD family protein [Flavobacterium sp. JLP]